MYAKGCWEALKDGGKWEHASLPVRVLRRRRSLGGQGRRRLTAHVPAFARRQRKSGERTQVVAGTWGEVPRRLALRWFGAVTRSAHAYCWEARGQGTTGVPLPLG